MSWLYAWAGLRQRYADGRVLAFPDMRVARGDVLALTGANGAGKSTLLRLLAFLDSPWRGTLDFYGTSGLPPRREVTLLLQEPYLLKRSVLDNVAYGLRLRGVREVLPPVRAALTAVGFAPEDMLARQWFQRSGGEKQRVALAARLVLHPLALLLDEPTASVDTRSAEAIRQAVRAAAEQGTTVVAASHDVGWLERLGARRLPLGGEEG